MNPRGSFLHTAHDILNMYKIHVAQRAAQRMNGTSDQRSLHRKRLCAPSFKVKNQRLGVSFYQQCLPGFLNTLRQHLIISPHNFSQMAKALCNARACLPEIRQHLMA